MPISKYIYIHIILMIYQCQHTSTMERFDFLIQTIHCQTFELARVAERYTQQGFLYFGVPPPTSQKGVHTPIKKIAFAQ